MCIYIVGAWVSTFYTFKTNCSSCGFSLIYRHFFFHIKGVLSEVYILYSLMLQIDPYSFLTHSMCSVILIFFVIALARLLTIKSIRGSSFFCRQPGYYAFDILHMFDRRKRLKMIRIGRLSAHNL